MAHVGVERLGPGDGQHDGTQGDEGLEACDLEEADRVAGMKGGEHGRVVDDLGQAEEAQDREPDQHHRPEEGAYALGTAALDQEQAEEHDRGQRDDVGLERGCGGLEAFDGREHRDRRRDQPVAVEQSEAGDGQAQDDRAQAGAVGCGALDQRAQRQHAALATIVGAEDQQHVFDADDQDQRPEDEREDAQHGGLGEVQAAGMAEGFPHRVERAGPDIAVDDAERGQGQMPEIAVLGCGGVRRLGHGRRRCHPVSSRAAARAPLNSTGAALTPDQRRGAEAHARFSAGIRKSSRSAAFSAEKTSACSQAPKASGRAANSSATIR